jgi:hypothetical protein
LATIFKMEAEWDRNLHQNSATGMTAQASAISASMNPEGAGPAGIKRLEDRRTPS